MHEPDILILSLIVAIYTFSLGMMLVDSCTPIIWHHDSENKLLVSPAVKLGSSNASAIELLLIGIAELIRILTRVHLSIYVNNLPQIQQNSHKKL